jgi:hypothetical protein
MRFALVVRVARIERIRKQVTAGLSQTLPVNETAAVMLHWSIVTSLLGFAAHGNCGVSGYCQR